MPASIGSAISPCQAHVTRTRITPEHARACTSGTITSIRDANRDCRPRCETTSSRSSSSASDTTGHEGSQPTRPSVCELSVPT